MKLGNVVGLVPTKAVRSVYSSTKPKAQPQSAKSVREEVIARRKKQKDFSIIDMIKNHIEERITEKMKDILGIRF